MCGRITQYENFETYTGQLNWDCLHDMQPDTRQPRFNVPPGTRPLVLHRLDAGAGQAHTLFWGYKPAWYKRAPVSNARLDTILKGSAFWRGPFAHGRVLLPADGWYEWTGDKGDKQPWYIHARDSQPLLMAAIAAWAPGQDVDAAHGMAVVTDDAAGGMVDIHDRRPVCLTVADALEWVDPATNSDQAQAILAAARPESAFEWWAVTRAVGNSRYQQPDACWPLH